MRIMHPYTTPSSFFYFTQDRRYIVKTMSESEKTFLLQILEQYANHMASCARMSAAQGASSSLITRLLGCYSIRMYGTVQYFTVMSNALHAPRHVKIHERYDLKGSWIGRVSDAGMGC